MENGFKFGNFTFFRVSKPCKKVICNSCTKVAVLSYITKFEEESWSPIQALHVVKTGPAEHTTFQIVCGPLGGTQYFQDQWPAQAVLDLAELLKGENT